jgi:hypothetical protein
MPPATGCGTGTPCRCRLRSSKLNPRCRCRCARYQPNSLPDGVFRHVLPRPHACGHSAGGDSGGGSGCKVVALAVARWGDGHGVTPNGRTIGTVPIATGLRQRPPRVIRVEPFSPHSLGFFIVHTILDAKPGLRLLLAGTVIAKSLRLVTLAIYPESRRVPESA